MKQKTRSLELTLNDAYILDAAIYNNLIAIDKNACPEWYADLERMQHKIKIIANEIKYTTRQNEKRDLNRSLFLCLCIKTGKIKKGIAAFCFCCLLGISPRSRSPRLPNRSHLGIATEPYCQTLLWSRTTLAKYVQQVSTFKVIYHG